MEEKKTYKSFTELDVWQAAREFKLLIQQLVKSFPTTEKFRLEDQLIRASRSIGANIAEGYGRFTYKEQVRFCVQARGSLYEVYNHLIDAYDTQIISAETLEEYKEKYYLVDKLLNGYISWLKKMSNSKTTI